MLEGEDTVLPIAADVLSTSSNEGSSLANQHASHYGKKGLQTLKLTESGSAGASFRWLD